MEEKNVTGRSPPFVCTTRSMRVLLLCKPVEGESQIWQEAAMGRLVVYVAHVEYSSSWGSRTCFTLSWQSVGGCGSCNGVWFRLNPKLLNLLSVTVKPLGISVRGASSKEALLSTLSSGAVVKRQHACAGTLLTARLWETQAIVRITIEKWGMR